MPLNRKQKAAILLACFVVFLSVSFAFLLIESHHTCHGDDCPVCEQIAALTVALHSAVLFFAGLMLCLYTFLETKSHFVILGEILSLKTPILLKTKLLN